MELGLQVRNVLWLKHQRLFATCNVTVTVKILGPY